MVGQMFAILGHFLAKRFNHTEILIKSLYMNDFLEISCLTQYWHAPR